MRKVLPLTVAKKDKFREGGVKFKRLSIWLFCIPGAVVTLIFGWYPMIWAMVIAFQKFMIIGPSKWIGLGNFSSILQDPILPIVIKNTFYYALLSIGLTFIIPILVAILLMEMSKKTVRIMMWLWFIPLSSMASIVILKWMYNVDYGLLNGILVSFGLPESGWLNDPRIAMLCLVLPGLIMFAPGLIYIATIQAIPKELYENAHLEGASVWQQIWHISLPRLRPVISMMLILAVISNLQIFSQPYIMTGGGPGTATTVFVMEIYSQAFNRYAFGRASALAIILFCIILTLIIIQRKFVKENLDE